MDLELIGRTPCRSIKLPSDRSEERRVIEPSQLHQLADAVGPNWRAMIYVGGVMGLRFGEAAALQVQDVDLVEHRLYVSKTVVEANGRISIDVPKTSAGLRTLALPDPLVDELRDHIERSGLEDPEALLFGSSTGVPVRRSNFARRVFGPAVESCGLDGLTFHGLRHSAATQWVAAGLDARTVQHRLGHADPRLVLRLYAHVSSRADQEAARTTAETFWSKVDAGSARDGAESVERNP
ncbi:MAG: site-specific integrase [Actinomycetota bacterium]